MSLSASSYPIAKAYELPSPAEAANAAREAQVQAAERQAKQEKTQTEDRTKSSFDPFVGSGLDVTA